MERFGIKILAFILFSQEDDEAFIMPQLNSRCDHLQMTDEPVMGVVVRLQTEGKDTAESGMHLPCSHIMSRVTFQSRICDKADLRTGL